MRQSSRLLTMLRPSVPQLGGGKWGPGVVVVAGVVVVDSVVVVVGTVVVVPARVVVGVVVTVAVVVALTVLVDAVVVGPVVVAGVVVVVGLPPKPWFGGGVVFVLEGGTIGGGVTPPTGFVPLSGGVVVGPVNANV